MEKGLEDAAADQSARLMRKLEYLSVIGNIAADARIARYRGRHGDGVRRGGHDARSGRRG